MQVASVDVVQDSFQNFLASTEQRFDIVVCRLRTSAAVISACMTYDAKQVQFLSALPGAPLQVS